MQTRAVFVVEALRTPIGRYQGGLAPVRPDDLLAHTLRTTLERAEISGDSIDEFIAGCANQAGEDNRNVARMSLLLAGLPQRVPAMTVNRLCASGLSAINAAAQQIACGGADLMLAGGVESMSRAPLVVEKAEEAYAGGNRTLYDTSLGWRFPNKKMAELFPLEAMGETAENLAEQFSISREDQDRFAFESHQRALRAEKGGTFDRERISVPVPQRKGDPVVISKDEGPRADTQLEKLGQLRAVFRKGGTVTAGNSSTLNDGASCVILASETALKKIGRAPLARWVDTQAAGVDPRTMGIGPVPAIERLLERQGLKIDAIDLFELNEAFAAQALACIRNLHLQDRMEHINPNGGAIALGHPLGASGARITATLLHQMQRTQAKRGIAALCVGVGQGVATLFERV